MTAKNDIEMGAACLGYAGTVATWWRMKPSEDPAKKGWRQQPQVTVMVAEATDENGHTPASSVNISGVEALHALRSAIDEALEYETSKTENADDWRQKCDALFAEVDRLKIENAKYIGALLAIADWNNVWGPFPEKSENWRAMAIITAREAAKTFKQGENWDENES